MAFGAIGGALIDMDLENLLQGTSREKIDNSSVYVNINANKNFLKIFKISMR